MQQQHLQLVVVLLSMTWSTSTLGEVHLPRYSSFKSISVNLFIRAQALHSEQQQVSIHGVLLARVVTMVLVTRGAETLSPSPLFLTPGVGLERTVFPQAGPVRLLSTRAPLLKQILGVVEESLLVVVDCTPTWVEQE